MKYNFNKIWYLYRRNNWMLDPRLFFKKLDKIAINKPIFILGNQGGGLTLVSRILRRSPSIISVSDNSNYWSGADELQNVFGHILPKELTGIKYKVPKHEYLTPPRSWSYAGDDLISYYRNTENDYNSKLEKKLKRIIRYLLYRFGEDRNSRFIDKSQVFTVKLGLLDAIFRKNEAKYLLITRNPLVECPRAAMGKAGDMNRYKKFLDWDQRLKICTQHWNNSMQSFIDDKIRLNIKVHIQKFEDIILRPEETIREICNYLEIDFFQDMLPQEYHKIPFGSMYNDRWYPIRKDINSKYKNLFDENTIEYVKQHCRNQMKQLGY